jgi:hypothetical protein
MVTNGGVVGARTVISATSNTGVPFLRESVGACEISFQLLWRVDSAIAGLEEAEELGGGKSHA